MFKALWVWLTHYEVRVMWEDLRAVHYAKTYGEALEWVAQYPHGGTVAMVGKRGRLLAARY